MADAETETPPPYESDPLLKTIHGQTGRYPVYMPFGDRIMAVAIDTVLVSGLLIPLYQFVMTASGMSEIAPSTYTDAAGHIDYLLFWQEAGPTVLTGNLIQLFVTLLLFFLSWEMFATTPGKYLFRARLVDVKNGLSPTTGQCLRRAVGYVLSALPLAYGFWRIGWDARKRGWHDVLAGTAVVSLRKRPPKPPLRYPRLRDFLPDWKELTQQSQKGKDKEK